MISIYNLSYAYDDNLAIDNINLELSEGEIVFVIGQNGSGKSTLLSCLANIYKYKGEIFLDDCDIKKMPNKELRRRLGIVFQNPNTQIIFNSVYEDMKFCLNNLEIDDYDERIKSSLSLVSMSEYINSNPYNLSMGQKQRLALALVLATKPKYLLLDEITSMIDYQGKKEIYKLLKKLKEQKIGIIFSTNILDELIYADRIIILNKTIKENLTKKELFNNLDILQKYGFELPFNLQVIKKIGLDNLSSDITESELINHVS